MHERKPLLSVIIPHLNQPEALEACLDSLQSQTIDRAAFEVVVVDNGSTAFPSALVDRYPNTLLLQEERPGPGHARNRGVTAASGEILAFIDADCRANPDWLKCALSSLEVSPSRTILGGDVQIWHEPHTRVTAVEAYESVFAYRFKLYIEQHGFCGTGNLVVRKQDFDNVGPFQGIDVAEDIQWGRQALGSGYVFRYVPEMVVYHPARASFRELCVKWDRHIQHAVNAGGSNRSWQAGWIFRALAILVSPAADWIKVVFSPRLHGPAAKAKAIGILTAIRGYRAYKMIALLLAGKQVQWNRSVPAVGSDRARELPNPRR
jgi:glycosyltransferase involved in cell wall biosynthesis